MKTQPKITFLNVPASNALETHVLEKINKLDKFYPGLISCDVVIDQEACGSHSGKLYRPQITLVAPGERLNVHHAVNEDVYVAVRDAFSALQRQLKEYKREQRGDIKSHQSLHFGVIERVLLE